MTESDGPLEKLRELMEQPLFRQVAIGGLVLACTIGLGALIGTVLAVDGDGSGGSASSAPVNLRPAVVGELIEAPKAKPAKLDKPLGMGSRSAGLAVVALSEVESVQTKNGSRRPPEGSRMLAFRVADWPCEISPCEKWPALEPELSIDATTKKLTDGQDTYVAVVPPGTDAVTLSVVADGFDQSLSLLDQEAAGNNIELLAVKGRTTTVPIRKSFQLGERTSIQLTGSDGLPTDTFFRTVTIGDAERHFFLDGETPSSPENMFLVVTVAYTYPGQQQQSAFAASEATFVLRSGRVIAGRDLDPDPGKALLGFEVPAGIKGGTFVLGGTTDKVSTTGVQYTSTLQTHEQPVDFG